MSLCTLSLLTDTGKVISNLYPSLYVRQWSHVIGLTGVNCVQSNRWNADFTKVSGDEMQTHLFFLCSAV